MNPYQLNNEIARRQSGVIRTKASFIREAQYSLNLMQNRVIYYCILVCQQDRKGKLGRVEIPVNLFKEICGLKGKSANHHLSSITESMLQTVIQYWVDDPKVGPKLIQTHWLKSVEYILNQGIIVVELNERLQPYFMGSPYVETEFFYLTKYKSQYSQRLSEIFKSFGNKKIVDFYIDDLRRRLGLSDDMYPNYSDFKRRVLVPAIEGVNRYTNMHITLHDERRGARNKIVRLFFMLESVETPKLIERVQNGEFLTELSPEETEILKQLYARRDDSQNIEQMTLENA